MAPRLFSERDSDSEELERRARRGRADGDEVLEDAPNPSEAPDAAAEEWLNQPTHFSASGDAVDDDALSSSDREDNPWDGEPSRPRTYGPWSSPPSDSASVGCPAKGESKGASESVGVPAEANDSVGDQAKGASKGKTRRVFAAGQWRTARLWAPHDFGALAEATCPS